VASEDVERKRGEILDAALAIADEHGLAAVTMRAVAARVGLTPMALYPRVGGKDGLLDGILERLLAELLPTLQTPAGPEDRLRGVARAVRDLARRHPAAFTLLFARPSATRDSLRQVDAPYQALLESGIPPEHVPRVERLLSTFVLGYAASEVNGRFGPSGPRSLRGQLDAGDYPAHAAINAEACAPVDWDAEFEADLDDLEFLIRTRWSTIDGSADRH
jgi:AcrR family transcriptional regulator